MLLGCEIEDGGIDQPDRARPLAMAARLFVAHGDGPDLLRIDAAIAIGVIVGIGREQARNEAFAQQSAMSVAADRVEGDPGQRLAVRRSRR